MSQTKQIYEHLRERSITPIEALNLYGCFRLAARIDDLRREGLEIECELRQAGRKKWGEYRLK